MRKAFFRLAMIGVLALSCSCSHLATQSNGITLYLGIPLDEEYPGTSFKLDGKVVENKYYRVTQVQHATKDEYDRALAAGQMLFRAELGGTQFYAIEHSGDMVQMQGLKAWVKVLERKAYP